MIELGNGKTWGDAWGDERRAVSAALGTVTLCGRDSMNCRSGYKYKDQSFCYHEVFCKSRFQGAR